MGDLARFIQKAKGDVLDLHGVGGVLEVSKATLWVGSGWIPPCPVHLKSQAPTRLAVRAVLRPQREVYLDELPLESQIRDGGLDCLSV
eukprot:scaffold307947_cov27-Tisochrysis_lutea.AAC.3